MRTIPISVFHADPDLVLSCIRQRVDVRHKIEVTDLSLVRARLLDLFPARSIVDIVGHSNAGFLRFGQHEITDTQQYADIFAGLKAIGVAEIRLLGCEIGKEPLAAAAMSSLSGRPNMPTLSPSQRDLTCKDYNHEGLRPTAEPAVFNLVPPGVADPEFRLGAFLDQNLGPGTGGTRVNRNQITELEAYLRASYWCCCPNDQTLMITNGQVVKKFEMEGSSGLGAARVVDVNGQVYVLAKRLVDGVEMIYPVLADEIGASTSHRR